MAVSKEAKTAAPAAEATPEVAQSIALRLFRVKRYIRYGDNQVYEQGNVYEFDLEAGHKRLAETDPDGFPIFTIHKPGESTAPAKAAPKAPAEPKRVITVKPPVAKEKTAFETALDVLDTPTKVTRIDIPDEDPELAARLADIDKDDDNAVAV